MRGSQTHDFHPGDQSSCPVWSQATQVVDWARPRDRQASAEPESRRDFEHQDGVVGCEALEMLEGKCASATTGHRRSEQNDEDEVGRRLCQPCRNVFGNDVR